MAKHNLIKIPQQYLLDLPQQRLITKAQLGIVRIGILYPLEKTFEIYQEDLFAIVVTEEDSLMLINELHGIMEFHKNENKQAVEGVTVTTFVIDNPKRTRLNF